ncbi:MAG: prolyl oligopeptidase family serine peptidase [Haloarculaceae archaeon]
MADDLLEALASLPTFHHPTASPDGDEVAVYYDGSGRNELHVIDAETGERRRVSDGQVPRNARWHVEWSADGERVYYHRDEGGNEQNDVHALARDGTAEAVVEMAGQTVLLDAGPDGRLLLGGTRDGQFNLYSHDPDTGETTRLTDYERAAQAAHVSPDGDRIAYMTNESDDFDNRDVYVADADGANPRNLGIGETGAEAMPADWTPDGEGLLVADNTPDLGRCGICDLAATPDGDAAAVTWYGDGEYEESPVAVLPDGERFLATRTRECMTVPVVYDVESGDRRELDLPPGVAEFPGQGTVALDADRVLVIHSTPTTRRELLVYDLATDETRTLLEAEYGDVDPETFADAEYLTVTSDGVPETPARAVEHEPYGERQIEALLYDAGVRPSPLIVNPHGGPRGEDRREFDLYTQFLVSQGFSVLQVNYRGSTGRGRSFVRDLYGDWGGAEQGDIATAAEAVRDREWIDEDRVAVFGGSYGGYSAYWQLVQYPALYDAGVAWIGVTDLRDIYENTMPHYRTELLEQYLGTPEENPDRYDERSPIEHVENLDAPVLMVHGVNDHRVPVSQARLFREALEDAGFEAGEDGDFEYRELGEEGHASSDIDQKIRLFRLLADFLERRV